MVARVASFLAERLNEKSVRLRTDLLTAGALLHDIAKYQSIVSGGDHAIMGADLLFELGYPEVAQIVRCHVHLDEDVLTSQRITEELVVNYSDKRVKHTKVVGLAERFQDIQKRYGKTALARNRIRQLYEQSREMERLIFSKIEMDPETLNRIFRRKTNG